MENTIIMILLFAIIIAVTIFAAIIKKQKLLFIIPFFISLIMLFALDKAINKKTFENIHCYKTEFNKDSCTGFYVNGKDTIKQNFYSISEYNALKDSNTKYVLETYYNVYGKIIYKEIKININNITLFKNN